MAITTKKKKIECTIIKLVAVATANPKPWGAESLSGNL